MLLPEQLDGRFERRVGVVSRLELAADVPVETCVRDRPDDVLVVEFTSARLVATGNVGDVVVVNPV